MIGDLLLTWMSETGGGTISDFRSRAGWLARTENLDVADRAAGRWLRDTASLGHCEVDWRRGIWAAAPPVITRLPLADGLAVLAGARRPRLMRAIDHADIYAEEARRSSSESEIPAPATILIPFERTSDLEAAADDIGATYSGCAAERIAKLLTPTDPSTPAAPPAYDSPFEQLTAFSPPVWSPSSARNAALPEGLFREQINGRWRYTLRRDGGWYACELSAGMFAELARNGDTVIRWRPDGPDRVRTGTVFIDWGAPLPPVHSRALTLCSGFAPRFSAAAQTAIYDNVPREIAALVSASLGQTMRISS